MIESDDKSNYNRDDDPYPDYDYDEYEHVHTLLGDDVRPDEIEKSLANDFEDFQEQRSLIELELDRPTKRQLRNLFQPAAYEDALKKLYDDNVDIRAQAYSFLYRRLDAIGRYCMNPNCLDPILGQKRGRPRKYCRKQCEDADAQRRKRDREDPDRGWRLNPLDPDARRIRQGYAGNRRFKRKGLPYEWVNSAVSNELRAKLHKDAVEGSEVSPAQRIAEEIDGAWTSKHKSAQKMRGSLSNLEEEFSRREPDAQIIHAYIAQRRGR